MTLFLQTIFSGLTNGAIYAVMGIAIIFCYRTSRVVNLAQGESYMGAGMLMSKLTASGVALGLAAPAGLALAVVGSIVYERVALRPRLHWPVAQLVMIAVGVALVAEGLADALVGGDEFSFGLIFTGGALRVDGAAIQQQAVVFILVIVALAALLWWFFRRTVVGYAMTAVAERPETAGLLGINASRLRVLAFGIAGVLGFIPALLLVPLSPITYDVGLTVTLFGYVTAAIGNMQNIGVACIAGFGIGAAESLFGSYVNQLLAQPVVLGIVLIAILGVMSRNVRFGGVTRA